jgi:Spy/CpxP family protein refolding chaperone
MMTRRFALTAAGALLASMMLSACSQRQAAAPPPAQTGTSPRSQMAQKLGLTDQQKSEIEPVMQSARSQIAAIRGNASLSDQDKREEIRQIRLATLTQIRGDLTPVQQETFDQQIAQARAQRQAQHGYGGQGYGGQSPSAQGTDGQGTADQ